MRLTEADADTPRTHASPPDVQRVALAALAPSPAPPAHAQVRCWAFRVLSRLLLPPHILNPRLLIRLTTTLRTVCKPDTYQPFSNLSSVSCVACPDFMVTAGVDFGATDLSQCACGPGWYTLADGTCAPVPKGFFTARAGSTTFERCPVGTVTSGLVSSGCSTCPKSSVPINASQCGARWERVLLPAALTPRSKRCLRRHLSAPLLTL